MLVSDIDVDSLSMSKDPGVTKPNENLRRSITVILPLFSTSIQVDCQDFPNKYLASLESVDSLLCSNSLRSRDVISDAPPFFKHSQERMVPLSEHVAHDRRKLPLHD